MARTGDQLFRTDFPHEPHPGLVPRTWPALRLAYTGIRRIPQRTDRALHKTLALTWFIGLTLLFAVACDGDGEASDPTATPQPPTATATIAPSPTPDPVGGRDVDPYRLGGHVQKFAIEIGARVAGTPQEITARDYAADTLRSYGYDVSIQDVPFDASRFLPAEVKLGDGTVVGGYGLARGGFGTASGPVRDGGLGRVEDMPPGSMTGAIALIERGEITFDEKATNAVAAGAVAVVIFNDEGTAPIWALEGPASIPVMGIRQGPGQDIAAKVAAGQIEATVSVLEPRATAYNVVAKPAGVATCGSVTGGHIDSVPGVQGADDNASGSAAVLEVARVLAARGAQGTNCFALFGAEEVGLVGSEHFVTALTDAELNALRFMINLDVVGVDQPLWLIGDADMTEVARIEAAERDIETSPGEVPNGAGSDHASFQNAGVPVVFLYRYDDLIHTAADAIDRIVPARLAETVEVAVAVLEELAE